MLDDDPTGSQAVHDVQVVAVTDQDAYEAAFEGAAGTCFVLTSTRSLDEADAVALKDRVARGLLAAAGRLAASGRVQFGSRSDSTLHGHVMAEVEALQAARRSATGRGFDGVLLAPAFLEAGRCKLMAGGAGPAGRGFVRRDRPRLPSRQPGCRILTRKTVRRHLVSAYFL